MQRYKLLAASVTAGGISGIIILSQNEITDFFDVINKLSFSEFVIDDTYISGFLLWYFPILLFQILWGTFIYRHFCTASVYCFSRVQNRVRWFFTEAAKLYVHIVIYLVLIVIFSSLPEYAAKGLDFNTASAAAFVYYIVIHSLWLYLTTMMINIIAVRLESSAGFIATVGLQACMLVYYVVLQYKLDFGEPEDMELKTLLLKLNPLSHLVLKWHGSMIDSLDAVINEFNISFDLNESIAVFFILAAAVTAIGAAVVHRQELIVINRENGGSI